jgi:nucleoside 2-deoxyribosyltransferase
MRAYPLGVAVFEEIELRAFNPNVAIEVGYMYGLERPVLLLRERRMALMSTDVVGKIYRSFDVFGERGNAMARK